MSNVHEIYEDILENDPVSTVVAVAASFGAALQELGAEYGDNISEFPEPLKEFLDRVFAFATELDDILETN